LFCWHDLVVGTNEQEDWSFYPLEVNFAAQGREFSPAERAINEYWDATLEKGRKSGLRVIQLDVLEQRNAVLGAQRAFAESVNDYIEKKLRGE
jgi:hypothetical protein